MAETGLSRNTQTAVMIAPMPHDHSHHGHGPEDHAAPPPGHDHGHDHGHGHGHGHAHGLHGHSHAPADFGRAFAIGASLNAAFVVLQITFGLIAGSVALVADALHNLGDVAGLLLAWGAASMGKWLPTARRTYGWGRSSILASLVNGVVLMFGAGAIAIEAIRRFAEPAPVAGATVMWVAAAGILVNGGTALLFMRGREGDLNVRGAFMHLAADALVSLGVVLAGLGIMLTGWRWLDPVASLGIVVVIVWGTWDLLVQSVDLAMDAVPRGTDMGAVHTALAELPGVIEVHDLHVWALSTTSTALTAHVVTESEPGPLLEQACAMLQQRFRIDHPTLQVETPAIAHACRLRPAEVV